MSIDIFPIWSFFVGTFLLVLLAIETGFRVGHAMRRRSDQEKESPVSAISGAILGLAAFLMAFTFSIAADRHQAKRALVREEAFAIQTAWRRADFLPSKDRAASVRMMKQYLDLRLAFAKAGDLSPEKLSAVLTETARLQDRLWKIAVENARKDMNSDVAALYIDSLNQMESFHAHRIAVGIHARIPLEIWLALCLITALGMFSVGYQAGIASSKRSISWSLLAFSFALIFILNASLDRPDSGFLKITQQPLIDLRASMEI